MGLGDVKLAATMGLFLGRAVAPAILAALLIGSLVGVALIARHGSEARKMAIPFGPFLALGGVDRPAGRRPADRPLPRLSALYSEALSGELPPAASFLLLRLAERGHVELVRLQQLQLQQFDAVGAASAP